MLSGIKEKQIIKTGFIILFNDTWLGGLNYYRNLINIILEDDCRCIEPIIFTNDNRIKAFFNNKNVKIVSTKIFEKFSILWLLNKASKKILKREYPLEMLLKKYNIKILSHSMYMINDIIQIPWIPDFQHIHLPEFFGKEEVHYRDTVFERYAVNGDLVILSSENAKKDFCDKYPKYKEKAMVLNFVVPVINNNNIDVLQKYKIKKPFFYLPNQFWQHKNHKVVVEALTYLKDTDIIVYCSGKTEDYRNKEYFNELLEFISKNSLKEKFIILGVVPYEDVKGLMEECKAVINPSLFEGWSTTVEEAKSIGKRIILSDIDVHKEQNPEGAVFFKKNDARDLANKMLLVWNEPAVVNESLKANALKNLVYRKNLYRKTYYDILHKALETSKRRD